MMATNSWDEHVEPIPTMPSGTSDQTTSATPDFTLEEELEVDIESSTPTLTPSYTMETMEVTGGDTVGATPSLGAEEEVDRGGDATTMTTLKPTTTSIGQEEEEGLSTTESLVEEGTTSSVRIDTTSGVLMTTTRVTTLSSVEGGVTIGPTPAAACRSNVCKNGGTCLTRYVPRGVLVFTNNIIISLRSPNRTHPRRPLKVKTIISYLLVIT